MPTPTLCVEVVQLARYRLAALDGENPLGFREVVDFAGHLVRHGRVRQQVFGLHLGHGALGHVPVLQGQKRDKEVHQVLVDQTRVPQATCGTRATGTLVRSDTRGIEEAVVDLRLTVLVVEHRQRNRHFQISELELLSISSRFPEIQRRLRDALPAGVARRKITNGEAVRSSDRKQQTILLKTKVFIYCTALLSF